MIGRNEEREESEKCLSEQYKIYYDLMLANYLIGKFEYGGTRHIDSWYSCAALEELLPLFKTLTKKIKEYNESRNSKDTQSALLETHSSKLNDLRIAISTLEREIASIRINFMDHHYFIDYRKSCLEETEKKYKEEFQSWQNEMKEDTEALEAAIQGKKDVFKAESAELLKKEQVSRTLNQEVLLLEQHRKIAKEEIAEEEEFGAPSHEPEIQIVHTKKYDIKNLLLLLCGFVTFKSIEYCMSSPGVITRCGITAVEGACFLMAAYECGKLAQRYFNNIGLTS